MSRFDSGGFNSNVQRFQPGGVPQQRIGSLDAPGEIPLPPDFSSTHPLNEFAQAFGMAGDLAESIQRQQRRNEIKSEAEASALRGEGASQAEVMLPSLAAKIDNGEIPVGPGDTSPDVTNRILESATAGMNPHMAEGFRKRADGALAAYVQSHINKGQAAAKELTLKSINSDAVTAGMNGDSVGLLSSYKAALSITKDPLQAQEVTFLPALKSAAEAGDRDRFDVVNGLMGNDLFSEEIQKAEITLQNNEIVARNRRETVAVGSIREADFNGAPIESLMQMTSDAAKNGHIDYQTADQLKKEFIARGQRDLLLVEKTKAQSELDYEADSALRAGTLGSLGKRERILSNGTKIEESGDEAQQNALRRAFGQIAKTAASPEAAIRQSIELAATNGVEPHDWKNILKAGELSANQWNLALPGKDGKPPDLPVATISGYDLYKKLRETWGAGAESMTSDQSKKLYETAMLFEQEGLAGSTGPEASRIALLAAVRKISDPMRANLSPDESNRIKKNIVSELQGWFPSIRGTTIKNGNEVAQAALDRAIFYMSNGLDETRARKLALQRESEGRATINGWSVPLRDAVIPKGFEEKVTEAAKSVVSDWSKQYAEKYGVKESNMTLIPNQKTGFWIIVDGDTGVPVPFTPTVSTQELVRMAHGKAEGLVSAAKSAVVNEFASNKRKAQELDLRNAAARPKDALRGRLVSIQDEIAQNPNRERVNQLLKEFDDIKQALGE